MTTNNVLFEIGLEELPSRFIPDAQQQLKEKTESWLKDLRLAYETVESYSTPRRLAVLIRGLEDKQADLEEEAKGPAKHIALDKDGNWSKAAQGFTRGQGKTVDDIYIKDVNGTEYIFINKYIEGKKSGELLPTFKEVILSINFPKNMRWADSTIRFARPIRWIVALQDERVVPFEIEGVSTSNISYGHRFLGGKFNITNPTDYQSLLKGQYVIANPNEREALIRKGINQLEAENNWTVPIDEDLLEEVTHLVEYPTVFSGQYNERFLHVPEEVLITSMKEHQRYFPVRSQADGTLKPVFVAVRNGDDQHLDTVARGNEKVLRARLSDAEFFYEEDKKLSIDACLEKLTKIVFQEKLGTISEKVTRVERITDEICQALKVGDEVRKHALRAAKISKFDLVTNMVNEFTELQGIMGEKYARLFGEEEAVAVAINEHYMPRSANGELPKTTVGAILSVADKLDTIIGCISVGIIPTGSQDPYALRRQAIGILQMMRKYQWSISVEDLLNKVVSLYEEWKIPTSTPEELQQNINEFFTLRASYLLKEEGVEQDIMDAVLTSGIGNVDFTIQKAKSLAEKRQDDAFKSTQEALVRVLNIAAKGSDDRIDEALLENDVEKELYICYQNIVDRYESSLDQHQAEEALTILGELTNPIHNFFDGTMVMTEDEALRRNRLSLMLQISFKIKKYADLTLIQWKQHG
ncbi:glycine--tRNA ligase subunit beta [Radiobacillus kanasensis]|uniref:glycine--tRNA ligase subunit beta n=1 Tax=Radiobacillus kanasensis TaxID=2844358 RepID=UPI001E4E4DA7|nr:glycine--tRNA ligase subunit beta [Radiobacillus kanasensis]UFT97807.1 glycine--tRNA ligase subunit beta [Radiobacillus kanasensis]